MDPRNKGRWKVAAGSWDSSRRKAAGIWVAVLLSCLFFTGCSTPAATTTMASPGADTSAVRMRSLKEVSVVVDLEKPSGEPQGLHRHQIQNDIETRMRQAGVRVVPQAKGGLFSGVPIIYVNVSIAKCDQMYAFNADIMYVNTAAKQSLGSKPGQGAEGASGLVATTAQVREKVAELVTLFIKKHLS